MLLVHLQFRSSQKDVPQWDANLGIGARVSLPDGAMHECGPSEAGYHRWR
jgi:hypothetical protein